MVPSGLSRQPAGVSSRRLEHETRSQVYPDPSSLPPALLIVRGADEARRVDDFLTNGVSGQEPVREPVRRADHILSLEHEDVGRFAPSRTAGIVWHHRVGRLPVCADAPGWYRASLDGRGRCRCPATRLEVTVAT